MRIAWFLSLALVLLIAGCSGGRSGPRVEPLSVTLASLTPIEMGVLEQRYAARLRIQNPRPSDVDLQGINMEIQLNGKKFAKGVGKVDRMIPAFGEEVVEINVVSSLSDVINRIIDLTDYRGEAFRYRISGRLYEGTSGTYEGFAQTGEIEITTLD